MAAALRDGARSRGINFRYGLIMALCFMAGCGMIDLKSHWRNRPVVIDGKNTEWGNSLVLLDDKETSIGIMNDSEFIYIGLVTTNRNLRNQVARRGITFWFDVEGGKDEKFGVHYPLGFDAVRPWKDNGTDADNQSATVQKDIPTDDLEIEGPGKDDHHPMTFAEAGGIEAKYKIANGVLVYELKVPLSDKTSSPFAIGTKSGALIGVGAETSQNKTSPKPSEGVSEGGGYGGGAAWAAAEVTAVVAWVEVEEDTGAAAAVVEDHPPADRESRLQCGQKCNWQCVILPWRNSDSDESQKDGLLIVMP